jgi:DNA-binding CsgD family transcriptional regulator
MRQNGYTTNEIALALGYQPHQVKSAVQRGERLNSLKEE